MRENTLSPYLMETSFMSTIILLFIRVSSMSHLHFPGIGEGTSTFAGEGYSIVGTNRLSGISDLLLLEWANHSLVLASVRFASTMERPHQPPVYTDTEQGIGFECSFDGYSHSPLLVIILFLRFIASVAKVHLTG
jgi:hypothetical protein